MDLILSFYIFKFFILIIVGDREKIWIKKGPDRNIDSN